MCAFSCCPFNAVIKATPTQVERRMQVISTHLIWVKEGKGVFISWWERGHSAAAAVWPFMRLESTAGEVEISVKTGIEILYGEQKCNVG